MSAAESIEPRIAALEVETGLCVDRSREACGEAGSDFGGLVQGRALGVAQPRAASELLALVRAANRHMVALTPRGTGRGQSGQSVARDSLSVSLRGLGEIAPIDLQRPSVWCGAGATWRELLAQTGAQAHHPYVLPLNLDLSVGGVLSAGGFGSTSHRYGALVEHVTRLEVVTGAGELRECDREQDSELFRAALGGLGRVAFITRACVALRPVAARVRTFYLLYTDVARFLSDQRLLSERGRADHLEGFCSASVQGLRKAESGRRTPFALWSYGLHVSIEYAAEVPDTDVVLAGLQFDRLLHIEDDTTSDFAARYDVRFEAMRALGAWQQLHPWLECLLPLSAAERLLPRLLEQLPLALGDGHRVTWVGRGSDTTSVVRPEESPALAFAILPMGVVEALREPMLAALSAVERTLLAAGGKRYLSGWLFGRDEGAWHKHFGPHYEVWKQHKERFDPRHILRSELFPD